MTPSQAYITIQLLDKTNMRPLPRNVQWRTMQGYRNQGNCLVHMPSAAAGFSNPPVVLETYDELTAYNRDGYVYELVNRPTYHVATYSAALSIICDPLEPQFSSPTDCLVNFRDFYTLLSQAERDRLTTEWAAVGPMKRKGKITNRFDCLLSNAKASGIVSTVCNLPELTEESVRDAHDNAMYAYFLATRLESAKSKKLWSDFFKRTTYIYLGGTAMPASPPTASRVWGVAQELGVRLLVKAGHSFAMMR